MAGKMKKALILCFVLLLLQPPCFARDFIVEFVEENYKETQSAFSYFPLIYHSIQVRCEAGPKLLILTGDNYHYRKWLRQYIAEGKAFIAKVPNDQDDLFISSDVFKIDVTNIHPFNLSLYRQAEEKNQEKSHQYELGEDRCKAADKNRMNQGSVQGLDKKKVQKKAAKKKRPEIKKILKARAEQQAADALQLKKENDQLFAALARQSAADEKRRWEELEQRWLALKKRLMEDERIRDLEQEARTGEITRRWLELKQRLGLE